MPKPGYKQSLEHKRKRAKKLEGEQNPAYKDGRRSYRRLAKAKTGEVVHHKNGDRTNNKPSNLERLSDGESKPGRRTTPKHEAMERRRSDAYFSAYFKTLEAL